METSGVYFFFKKILFKPFSGGLCRWDRWCQRQRSKTGYNTKGLGVPDEGIEMNSGIYKNHSKSLHFIFHTLGSHNSTSLLKIQFFSCFYVLFGGREVFP